MDEVKKELGPLPGQIGVYDEIDRLQRLAIWGEPGCCTVLGQLLPTEISLFYERFDVAEARREFAEMEDLLIQAGVEVVRIKDVFAQNLRQSSSEGLPRTIDELSALIKQKGRVFHQEFGVGDIGVLDLVDGLLAEDAEQYGEETAIKLNWTLSVASPLPLADIFYSRDQSNVLGGRIVMSRMKWPIRTPEVTIYSQAYSNLGYQEATVSPTVGNLEGGDAMIFNNTCYIGVGTRTSREAVAQVYGAIGEELKRVGIRMVAVVDPEQVEMAIEKPGADMDAMHLDTFWMPVNKDTVLACGEEVEKRRVELVSESGFEDIGTFIEHMAREGWKIIDISKAEQRNYSTNFLHLGNGKAIVPLSENTRVIGELHRVGLEVIPAEIKQLVGGYGAVHCMTAALKRGKEVEYA